MAIGRNQGDRKDKYKKLCLEEASIPIFSLDWWLDATAGAENWDVALVEKGSQVVASMPYVSKSHYGMQVIAHPSLTQTLGPWIRPTDAKYAKRLAREKDLMEELIEQLPSYADLYQNWHYSVTNWFPFYLKGFKQTTRYTYRIDELEDEDRIWSGFQPNIRTDIKKAINREAINVRLDLNVDDFYQLNKQVFDRQNKPIPYTLEFVRRLDRAAAIHDARQIFIAEDELGRRHAAVYLVWDKNSAYYLMGGGDPELRRSGATSLCLWEAIKFASRVTKSFDFEGSMLEPVERFFRAFGAVQTPYHSLSHTPSKTLRMARAFRELGK